MVKLSAVFPVTGVEVNGQKYRKVEREAKAGDIVKVTEEDLPSCVIEGAFYEVKRIDSYGDPRIIDEDGDEWDLAGDDFEVYEKVTEDVQSAAPKYREVIRKAKVGERIRIVRTIDPRYSTGDEFAVAEVATGGGDVYVKYPQGSRDGLAAVLKSEYVVLEPVESAEPAPEPKPERLKVGEYAKVIDAVSVTGRSREETYVGEIRKIIEDDATNVPYRAEKLDGTDYDWFRADALDRATEAEVEAAKQALKIGEFAGGGYAVIKSDADGYFNGVESGSYVEVRPTITPGPYALEIKIMQMSGYNNGFCNADALRKVTREEYEQATDPRSKFAKGDKVRLISGGESSGLFDYSNGQIYTVGLPESYNGKVEITGGGQPTGYAEPHQLEKVSAEEVARIEEEAAETKKWAAIGRKVGEFKAGDVVRVIKTCPIADTKVGDVTTVDRKDSDNRGVFLTQLNSGGSNAYIYSVEIELIAPVEQRFDQAQGSVSKGGADLSK